MTEWVDELTKLDPKAMIASSWKDSDVSIDKVVFADHEHPIEITNQIFLAGPTPRDRSTPTWRPEAVKILRSLGYNGHIFVPEDSSLIPYANYDKQIDWEQKAIRRSDCVLFWVPRELEKMPGFTTNVEFGDCLHNANVVLGYPDGAEKVAYLVARANERKIPVKRTLKETCSEAIAIAGEPSLRKNGETSVPNYIWSCSSFQKWYQSQHNAGNELVHSEVDWVFRIPSNQKVFSFALKAQVYVSDEDRVKDNEFIISRSDIGAALLYYKDPRATLSLDSRTKIVLIREFRTPARTPFAERRGVERGFARIDRDVRAERRARPLPARGPGGHDAAGLPGLRRHRGQGHGGPDPLHDEGRGAGLRAAHAPGAGRHPPPGPFSG